MLSCWLLFRCIFSYHCSYMYVGGSIIKSLRHRPARDGVGLGMNVFRASVLHPKVPIKRKWYENKYHVGNWIIISIPKANDTENLFRSQRQLPINDESKGNRNPSNFDENTYSTSFPFNWIIINDHSKFILEHETLLLSCNLATHQHP